MYFPLSERVKQCIGEQGYQIGKFVGQGISSRVFEESSGRAGHAVVLLQGGRCITWEDRAKGYKRRLERIREDQKGDLGEYVVRILDLIDCPYPLTDDPRYCQGMKSYPLPIQILEYLPRSLYDYIATMEASTKLTRKEKDEIEEDIVEHARDLVSALKERGWVHVDPSVPLPRDRTA